MRKKVRTITVGETRYSWRIATLDQSHVLLKVWGAKRDRSTLHVGFRFDDPWIHCPELLLGAPKTVDKVFQTTPLTPYAVRKAIEACLELGWQPTDSGPPFNAAWDGEGFLRVEDASAAAAEHYDDTTGRALRPPTRPEGE